MPIFLAHPLDTALRRQFEEGLLRPGVRPSDGTKLLLATPTLAASLDQPVVDAAIQAWADGDLLVLAVDGATPPLGLRDVPILAWDTAAAPGPQLDAVMDRLALMSPPSAAAESPRAAARPAGAAKSRRGPVLAIAAMAAVVACAGLIGGFMIHQMRDASAPRSVSSEPRAGSAAPPPAAAPMPARPAAPRRARPDPQSVPPSGSGAQPPAPIEPVPERLGPTDLIGSFALIGLGALLVAGLVALVMLARRRRRPANVAIAAPPTTSGPASGMLPHASDAKPIFVSYSRKDTSRVDPIIAEIEALGHGIWLDRRELSGGPGWAGQVVRGLRAARAVVLMASPQAYASDQVMREMYLAMSEKKPIVPLELEPADMPDELLYILAPFQRHRLHGGDPRAAIVNALAAL